MVEGSVLSQPESGVGLFVKGSINGSAVHRGHQINVRKASMPFQPAIEEPFKHLALLKESRLCITSRHGDVGCCLPLVIGERRSTHFIVIL